MCKRDLKIGLLLPVFVLFPLLNSTAVERVSSAGAREAGLSQAMVALSGSYAVFHNQAFLTENKSPILGLSYRQPYFIAGYCESALAFVYPVKSVAFAMGVTQSSVSSYRESNLGIAIAKKLTGRLSAGLLFNCFFLNFPESDRHKGSFLIEGGISYQCSDNLKLGFHLKNIAWSKIETYQYNLTFPLVIRSGASYLLSDRLLLAGEAVFENDFGLGFRSGAELMLMDNFRVRGGISTNPFQHSIGFGYQLNFCQLDFAMVHHEMLGYSPIISFSFSFK